MSERRPASGASASILRFAKSDDGISYQGRRASRANQWVLDSVAAYASNAS
jgi:hypothetical protein